MLVGIASEGVVGEDIELFSWPLSDSREPLIAALQVLLIGMLGDAMATRLGRLNPSSVATMRRDDHSELHPDQPADSAIGRGA